MTHPFLFWGGFHLLLFFLLAVDLILFRREKRPLEVGKAWVLSAFWIGAALLFNWAIYLFFGSEKAVAFFTGYLVEKSLSVDNLFVFTLIFTQFHIAPTHRYKVLFWGILGVFVLRIALILTGISLITTFHWIFYLLGLMLIFSAIKLALEKKKKKGKLQIFVFQQLQRFFPFTATSHGGAFLVKERGKFKVTTLLLVLIIIECTDVIFALDSVPAIFAITTDPFIVYTSNVFAILGLRSLYFVIAGSLDKLKYFKWALSAILLFVGSKMLFIDAIKVSVGQSLVVIASILGVVILCSWARGFIQGRRGRRP